MRKIKGLRGHGVGHPNGHEAPWLLGQRRGLGSGCQIFNKWRGMTRRSIAESYRMVQTSKNWGFCLGWSSIVPGGWGHNVMSLER